MTEYGLFNDEGMLEGQFYSLAEALAAIDDRYVYEDGVTIHAVCPWHAEQRADTCEECWAEEDE